jgi:glycosyltransferase involved in cell wall biosynthesis
MHNEPLVSVCCITYNHEKYIREAIEGFLMQETSFPIEILIHDDASTDKTADIIREYEAKYPNIIKPIYQTENQYSKGVGISATYQWPRAKGKYIALCEGDDYWTDPYKLQKQVDFLEANPEYGICFTYSKKVDENGNDLDPINNLLRRDYTQYDFLVGKKFQTRTATILVRSPFLQSGNFPKNIHNGDTWVKILATENNKKGALLPFISACYRIHSGGVWSNSQKKDRLRKRLNDWKVKLRYAVKFNKKTVPVIALNIIRSYLAIYKSHLR